MATHFELFRLSLLARNQIELFDNKYSGYDRESWLRTVFSESRYFECRGSEYAYAPAQEIAQSRYLIGRMGKHLFRDENRPPEEALAAIRSEAWLASLVIVDPMTHEDGQKLAMQIQADVGNPVTLVKAFVDQVNHDFRNGPFVIEVSQIIEPSTFWTFVEHNEGRVTSVEFDFIAPNMLGTEDEFMEDMRRYRDLERARKVVLGLKNPEGLNAKTETVKRAVNYAEKGGGTIKARAMGRKSYDSRRKSKRATVEDDRTSGIELVKALVALADKALGRE